MLPFTWWALLAVTDEPWEGGRSGVTFLPVPQPPQGAPRVISRELVPGSVCQQASWGGLALVKGSWRWTAGPWAVSVPLPCVQRCLFTSTQLGATPTLGFKGGHRSQHFGLKQTCPLPRILQ